MLKSLLDRLVQAALSDKTRPRKVQWALFGFIVVPVLLVATISSMQTYKDLTKAVLARREAFASLAAATLKERIDRLMDLGLSLGHPAPGPPAGRGRSLARTNCSGCFSVSTPRESMGEPASGLPPCSASSTGMAAGSGPKGPRTRGQHSTSPSVPEHCRLQFAI